MGYRKIMHKPFIGIARLPNREILRHDIAWALLISTGWACLGIMSRRLIGIVLWPSREMQKRS